MKMKSNLKKGTLLLGSLLAVSAITACGGSGSSSSSVASEPIASSSVEANPVTINFWTKYYAKSEQYGTNNDYEFLEAAKREYTAAHPNVTINIKYEGSYNNIQNDLNANWGKETLPSMAMAYPDWAYVGNQNYSVRDMSAVAADLLNDTDFDANIFNLEKSNYSDGKYYTLPYLKTSEMLTVNQTMFDEKSYAVPTTWEDMITVARKMKEDYPTVFTGLKDADNKLPAVPFIYESADNLYISLMEQKGIDYVKPTEAGFGSIAFNNQAAKDLVIQLKKWNNEGLIGIGSQLTGRDYPADYLKAWKTAMIVSSTTGANYFADGDDSLNRLVAKITDTPKFDASSSKKVMSQGASIMFIRKSNQLEMDTAVDFYKFLVSKENLAKRCSYDASAPFRKSVVSTEPYKSVIEKKSAAITKDSSYQEKADKYVANALDVSSKYATENSLFTSPVFAYSAACRNAVRNLITTVFDATATTDAEIASAVNSAFQTAYDSVTQ